MTFRELASLGLADHYVEMCGIKWGADELKSYWNGLSRDEAIKVLKDRRDMVNAP